MNRCYLEITNICNLSCSFCHKTKRKKEMMDYDRFDLITDKIKGNVKFLYFHLMGEPLLNPNISSFIKLSKEKGMIPIITTNGTLLKEKGLEIIESKPYKINISIHSLFGNDDMKFDDYLESISKFSIYASSKGIIISLRLWIESEDNTRIINKLKEYFCEEWFDNEKGYKLKDNVFLEFDKEFEWPDINLDPIKDNGFCYGLRNQFGILVDGTITPCCLDSDGIINLGNILNNSIDEILNSKRARNIYDSFSNHFCKEELCKRCGYILKTKEYHKV